MKNEPIYKVKSKGIQNVYKEVSELDYLDTLTNKILDTDAFQTSINGSISDAVGDAVGTANAQFNGKVKAAIESDLQVKQAIADFLLTYYGLTPTTPIS
jgi:hypothetical protein